MESLKLQLVSDASAELFPDKILSYFEKLPEQLSLEGQWEVAVSEIPYPSMYQNVREGKYLFFSRKRIFTFV